MPKIQRFKIVKIYQKKLEKKSLKKQKPKIILLN